MNTTTIIMLALLGLSVAEGVLAIWLLWKLCRKTEAVQTKAKTRTGRKTKKLKEKAKNIWFAWLLLRNLNVKNHEDAYKNLIALRKANKSLEDVLQKPENLQNSKEKDKILKILKEDSLVKLGNLVTDSKNYETLLENPLAKTNNDKLSESNLGSILSDLQSLKSYVKIWESKHTNGVLNQGEMNSRESGENGSRQGRRKGSGSPKGVKEVTEKVVPYSDNPQAQITFQSDFAKEIFQPILSDAEKFGQVKQYEPYYANITNAISRSFFNELPIKEDTYNVRILLAYLSQLYSISKILGAICEQQNGKKSKGEIAPHKENVKPFLEKEATLEDIIAVGNKGEKFRAEDMDDKKLIDYLEKYKPLNFNLIGMDFSNVL